MSIFGNTNSGGGLFGNTTQPQQQQPAPTNIFGSTTTNPNPTPNPLTAQPTQPSLFGNTNTNTTGANSNTTGGLFGSTNTNTAQNTAAPAGGGLFGSTNTTNQPASTGTGLFGAQPQPQQPATTGSSLFGTTTNNPLFGNTGTGNATTSTTGTSLFGNASNTGTSTTSGGLFGNTGQQTQAGANTGTTGTGGGLFGSTTTNTGGGLFGSSTNTGGGLFGANANTQQPAQQTGTGLFGSTQTGGGLFGGAKPATPVAGGGLFGSTTTPATNTTTSTGGLFGGSLFGQPQQQQQQQPQPQQQQPGLFGSTAGNSLFGGNRSTLGTSALGAPSQQTPGFGTSTSATSGNLLSSRSATGAQQQPADAQAQFQQLLQSIEKIYNSWNPQSLGCQFQYYFYNLVDPKQVNLYGRPPNATNDALWEKAVRENPDPSCLVPVVAVGFDDLRQRIDAQGAQSSSHLQKLNDLKSRLAALRTQHEVSNSSRLLRAASMQTQLTQRLMRLIQHLHLLIPAVRSSALTPEEEALRGKLEELEEEMKRTRVKGRLNELWALIGALSASMERSAGAGGAGGEWAVVDEEGLAQIAQILSEQQAGLQHLTKILQKGQKDLNVIWGKKAPKEEDSGEALWDSTSTLRASALR